MAASKSSGVGETIRTVVYAVLIAFAVRTFLYEPFNIPSGSMMPTLLEGDYLFVSKFSYGYSRHTIAFGMPLFEGRVLASEPERGDVVVFKLPSDPSTDYIKRLIGLPGDRVQMIEGILHINGEPAPRRRVEDFVTTDRYGRPMRIDRYVETLPNGREHFILEQSDSGFYDNTDPFEVPEGHYFFMGDNRDRSQDSRVPGAVGFVPAENLVGRAEFLWFSLDAGTSFWEVWNWPTAIRFGRLFEGIE
jgi:signal peptidase I